jgi:hypothetical protein
VAVAAVKSDGERLDDAAMLLADGYAKHGYPAFLIRVTEDGNVRLIGPQLPRDTTVALLRSAATLYEQNMPDDTKN